MKVITRYRQTKEHRNMRYFFNDREVTKAQADVIKAVGGNVVTDRTDEWFWRNWS